MIVRTEQIHIRLSPEEKEAIASAAASEGLALSVFMRWAALQAAKK